MNGNGTSSTFCFNPWKILGWIADIMAGGALAFCIWIGTQLNDIGSTIQEIQIWRAQSAATNWSISSQDIYATKQETERTKIWQEIASMKTEWMKTVNEINLKLAALPNSLQIPPRWWEEYVRQNIAEHNERLKKLESKR